MVTKRFTQPDGSEIVISLHADSPRVVSWGNASLELSPVEWQILALLLDKSPYVVTKPMCYEVALDRYFDPDTNLIDVHVGSVRKKVESFVPRSRWLIQSVRGRGFKISDVKPVSPSEWTPIHIEYLFRKLKAGAIAPEEILSKFPDMSHEELTMWTEQFAKLGKAGLRISTYQSPPRVWIRS